MLKLRKYFIGVEAEGPFKGTLTLFIASEEAPLENVESFLRKHPDIKNIYYGACRTYGIPTKYLPLLKDTHWTHIIETNCLSKLKNLTGEQRFSNVFIVFSITDDEDIDLTMFENFMLKINGYDGIMVHPVEIDKNASEYTPNSDIRFLLDTEIEL